ncbi:MAG: cell division protein SepF [Ruminococcaceae bacterium]|nr:cell division protein SepF [Oscillospiraceae bacterium]
MKNPFARKPRSNYDSYNDSYDGGFYRGEEPEDGIVGDFEEEVPAAASTPRKPAPAAPTAGSANQFKVVKPRGYQDGPNIADYLVDGYTVVLNIEDLERPAALRLIDFLLGALQVLGGGLRRVTKTTLVLSPRADEIADEDEDGIDDRG